MENRITDPKRVSSKQIREILSRGARPTIQFSRRGYSRRILKSINKLCAEYGDRLEVRFYGHEFDASVLRDLPEAQWLSTDCLLHIRNEDAIAAMPALRKLSFGTFHFDRPGFLAEIDLADLTRLVLSENKKKNLDLAPLRDCSALEELYVSGHRKNISAISRLPQLKKLSLGSITKRQALDFVNEIPRLEKLTIILGGRENIDEVAHVGLRELEVLRVRGISSLGDLSRFPVLRRLLVEDQIQLQQISVAGTSLEEVSIHNCKSLDDLQGLLDLDSLRVFRTSRTKLDLERYLNATWPESMESVALYSGSEKWNEQARALMEEKGYSAVARRY